MWSKPKLVSLTKYISKRRVNVTERSSAPIGHSSYLNFIHCIRTWNIRSRNHIEDGDYNKMLRMKVTVHSNYKNSVSKYQIIFCSCYFGLVWLVGFLTSLSTTRLYRERAPRQSVWKFYVLPHMRQSWETMTSVTAGHIILTPTQPVGSGRTQPESNPGPPHQELHALSYRAPRSCYLQFNITFHQTEKRTVLMTLIY